MVLGSPSWGGRGRSRLQVSRVCSGPASYGSGDQGPWEWPQCRLNDSLHDYVGLVSCNEKDMFCHAILFFFLYLFKYINIPFTLIMLRICIIMLSC